MSEKRLRAVMAWFKRVVTQPRSELTRWQAWVRSAVDLGRHGLRQLKRDRAPQMAAALAFRTLFGLLPVLVVGTVLFKAVGGYEQFHQVAAEIFTSLGMDQMHGAAAEPGGASQSLSALVLGFMAEAQDMNLAAITWVGMVVLIYSAMSLMVTIETSCNNICRAPEGRPWMHRLTIYWTALTLGPAAITASIYLKDRLDIFVAPLDSWGGVLNVFGLVWAFVVPWMVLTALYKSIPNTHVGVRPALAGAFVATAILGLGKHSLAAYVQNAISVKQLYGAFGLVPLFMFWVYLMWLVVLFGLEVSATLQGLRGMQLSELESSKEESPLIDPASVIAIMRVVADRFEEGGASTPEQLARATGMSGAVTEKILERLVADGFLHRVERAGLAVSLSRPPESIEARELLELGFALADRTGSQRVRPLLSRFRDVQLEAASSLNLGALTTETASEA